MKSQNSFTRFFFFGNYFYGICAVALAVETTVQQLLPLYDVAFYVALFIATVTFYTRAYIVENENVSSLNLRTQWYISHQNYVVNSQVFFLFILFCWIIFFIVTQWDVLMDISFTSASLIVVFPLTAVSYYGTNSTYLRQYNLRSIGWIKPFIIGFTWAGIVTFYPAIHYTIVHHLDYQLTLTGNLLFLVNFIFITVLSILFDIKDYAGDSNRELKTFIVKIGLRKTISFIIMPLVLLGYFSCMFYCFINHFSLVKIIMYAVPYLLLIIVTISMQKRRPILYYLFLIDGLMLAKAFCNILAMKYF
jgi:4-hydroxybenzoate polyprenyltransferase